ncbi:MAG: glycosyltransferase family 9 protein [Acidobacteriota bacterium]|nr:MAG: glycosyltransferase family 9 protein [Acidobacteriota bacterium]
MTAGSIEGPGRILVFRIGHLGDTIVALPAFRAIRRRFPDSHIAFLCNASEGEERRVPATSVLPEKGLFDELIGYRMPGGFRSTAGALRLIRRLRRSRFDTVFYLMTRNRTASRIARDRRFFKLCGVGRIACDEFVLRNLLELPVAGPLPRVDYEGDFLLRSLREEFGEDGHPKEAYPDLQLTRAEKERASNWLSAVLGSPPKGRRLMGIGPGSKWDSKIWPEDRFRSVVGELVRSEGVFPVVFGGPEDKEKGERLVSRWGTGAVAAGSLNVREAGAALSFCDLYLGNDTGTMHLAAAAGVPCVAVFAAIDYPGRWEPPGAAHRMLRTSVPCEGCHTPDCFNDHLCLTSVGTEEVLAACLEVIDGNRN